MTHRQLSIGGEHVKTKAAAHSLTSMSHSRYKLFLGLFFLAICITSDIIEAASLRSLQTDQSYRKPFFLLWMSQSAFTVILPASIGWLLWQEHKSTIHYSNISESKTTLRSVGDLIAWLPCLLRPSTIYHGFGLYKQHTVQLYRRSFTHFVLMSASLSAFHLAILYVWYIALGSTTVGQVSAIFNTSCFFTYIFSMWILKQKAESRKLLAVLSSVLGILVITFDDMPWSTMETGNEQVEAVLDAAIGSNSTIIADYSSDDADIGVILPAIWADALLALSAICYGLYEVIFAKYSTTDLTIPLDDDMIDNTSPLSASPSKRLSTEFPPSVLQSNHGNHDGRGDEESLFLANQIIGFIGLTTILIWWVPIIILNSTNVETFGLPQDQHTWALIAVDIICSFLHNTLYMLTITLIGPVFASIGATLIIPFGVLADYVVWQELSFGQQGLIGCLLIMLGFVLFLVQNFNLPFGSLLKQLIIGPVHFVYSRLAAIVLSPAHGNLNKKNQQSSNDVSTTGLLQQSNKL